MYEIIKGLSRFDRVNRTGIYMYMINTAFFGEQTLVFMMFLRRGARRGKKETVSNDEVGETNGFIINILRKTNYSDT